MNRAIGWCFLLCFRNTSDPPCIWLCMASLSSSYLPHPTLTHCFVLFFSLSLSLSVFFSFLVSLFLSFISFPISTSGLLFLSLYFIPLHPFFTLIGIHAGLLFLLFSVDPVPLPFHLALLSGLGWTCCVFGCQVSMGWKSLI